MELECLNLKIRIIVFLNIGCYRNVVYIVLTFFLNRAHQTLLFHYFYLDIYLSYTGAVTGGNGRINSLELMARYHSPPLY